MASNTELYRQLLLQILEMQSEQRAAMERIEARLAEQQAVNERVEARLIALEVKRQHASPVPKVTTPRVTLPTPPSSATAAEEQNIEFPLAAPMIPPITPVAIEITCDDTIEKPLETDSPVVTTSLETRTESPLATTVETVTADQPDTCLQALCLPKLAYGTLELAFSGLAAGTVLWTTGGLTPGYPLYGKVRPEPEPPPSGLTWVGQPCVNCLLLHC